MTLDNSPLAVIPNYENGKPNQTITLYEGILKVLQQEIEITGGGTVCYVWFPHPRVEFKFSLHSPSCIEVGESSLELPELGVSVPAFVSNVVKSFNESGNYLIQLEGRPKEPVTVGLGTDLKYLQFHLTNFCKFQGAGISVIQQDKRKFYAQRVVLEAGGWTVTIDEFRTTENSVKLLKAQGGYVVTHVGKLEHSDGTVFQADEARDFLKVLTQFFSIIRGFWISPLLLVGYDSNDKPVWKEWSQSISDSWQGNYSWSWGLKACSYKDLFPGFLSWLQDWGESAELAIYWYIETNKQAGGLEGSLILSQAALELLAWVVMVEKGDLSEETFNNDRDYKPPSKKIKCLLEKQGIPVEIPDDLVNLIQFEKKLEHSARSGPYAVTKLRNNVTHSAPKNRQKLSNTSTEEIQEAWRLSLYYIELVILSLSKYQGSYFNRLTSGNRWYGNLESVPWN